MVYYSFYLNWRKKPEDLVYRVDSEELIYSSLAVNVKYFETKAEAEADFRGLLWDNPDYRTGEYIDTSKGQKKEKKASAPQKKKEIVFEPKPKREERNYDHIQTDFVYNEDCLKTMARMPNLFVDYIITSPPYNVGKRISFGKNNAIYLDNEEMYSDYEDELTPEEYEEWLHKVIDECIRVTRYHVFFNIQMLSKNKATILRTIGKYHANIKEIVIWDKSIASPNIKKGIMRSKYEFIIIFSNENPESREFKDVDFSGSFSNVITGVNASRNQYSRVNKCTFPLYLPRTILHHFCKKGNLVYDPFNGTGTTAEAAAIAKMMYIGSELDPVQCDITNRRIQEEKARLKFDFSNGSDIVKEVGIDGFNEYISHKLDHAQNLFDDGKV